MHTLFGCDLRTLALLRVNLGGLLIVDLILRARDLGDHYTDAGVLPRAALLETATGWRPSLHLVSGSAEIQALLLIVAGLVAVALMVGYRTRLATVVSWVLLISLHNRNPMVLQGGDVLLRMLLFWGMFLPLGARYSVDAALRRPDGAEPNRFFSLATMALLVQVMSVYFFSALLKSDPVWIPDGTAVYYALSINYHATPVAEWLRQFPRLLQGLTYYVWCLELIAPILMFSPVFHRPLRLVLMVLLITMHVGFILCLRIGLFPYISIASLLAFTPGWVWDRLEERVLIPSRTGGAIYYDGECAFCLKVCLLLRTFLVLPGLPIIPAQNEPDIHGLMQRHVSWVVVDSQGEAHVRWPAVVALFSRSPVFWPLGRLLGLDALSAIGDRIYEAIAVNRERLGDLTAVMLPYRRMSVSPSLISNVAVGLLMLYVLYVNVMTLPDWSRRLPEVLPGIKQTLRLQQSWNMFAPSPTKHSGWWVARGVLEDGTPADVYHGILGEPTVTKPEDSSQIFSSYRWRKYLTGLLRSGEEPRRARYARYLCNRWNRATTAEFQLRELSIYYLSQKTLPDYRPSETTSQLVWRGPCVPAGSDDRQETSE